MTSFISSNIGEPVIDEVTLLNSPDILRCCIVLEHHKHQRTKPHPLSELSDLKIQQGLIIKDLLFSLLGYDGYYIRYSDRFDQSNIESRIKGPDFKIAKHLDISLKSITKKLVRYGKYYSGLMAFLEYYDHQNFGKVVQKLCFLITDFLNEYQSVIIELEHEFKFNSAFNLNVMENVLNQRVSDKLSHIYEIVTTIHYDTATRISKFKGKQIPFEDFIHNIRSSLKTTGNIDDSINSGNFEYCKGGLVLEIIQGRINAYKGDSLSLSFLMSLFDSVSEEYVVMLNNWLINGDIDDQFDEFLVRRKQVPSNLSEVLGPTSEHYWNELFVIRSDGLIGQFKSKEIQHKILNTGKFLNIFKACTGMENFQSLNEILDPINKIFSQDLELKIELFYERANKLLMKLLFEGYNLTGLIESFQTTFLINNPTNIDCFLEKAFYELRKNRYSISVTRLEKAYDEIFENHRKFKVGGKSVLTNIKEILNYNQKFAITNTNFYDVAKEIMNVESFDTEKVFQNDPNFRTFLSKTFERNQILSADSNSNLYDPDHSDEYAIASVDLTIDLPFPLNLIVNRELSYHYELMFKLKIIIKFINLFNNNMWHEICHSSVWKYSAFELRIKKWILRCRVLHSRMRDFIDQLQFYIDFDVIETNYGLLRRRIEMIQESLRKSAIGSDMKKENLRKSVFETAPYSNFSSQNTNLFNRQNLSDRVNSTANASSLIDTNNFIAKLNEYLNTIVNDSLITRPDLLSVLKNMFDILILFNNYLSKLKKGLILCDKQLFSEFSRDYPDRFSNKTMDEDLINNRIRNLNDSLRDHYEIFDDSLTEFIVTLKSYGEAENKQILILSERLETYFPEKI
ncbi:uncharacterized protein PRCAT00000471001 [Priceomyces carsonii]|uniref:uncharacterized protein n=1 Tax=Priceomyces carsonii TaxID=28549 RepID=UPI002ED7E193|nr:unnamed protein product [Priceomyces carsonii]